MVKTRVKGYRFTLVLREQEVRGYSVRCIELPGAISQGETREEALKDIKESIERYLEAFPDEIKILDELNKATGKREVVELTV